MMEEWRKDTIRIEPNDNFQYAIDEGVIEYTEKILSYYGNQNPSCEGLVYWGGVKKGNQIIITTCIAPKIAASRYNIGIDHYSNFRVVEALASNEIVHIAQVHSHPKTWVDHSETDDEYASFKVNGLLSIVVPSFCEDGMMPLTICGILRYSDGAFDRFTNRYIERHFNINYGVNGNLIDLRHE